ncbi:MAG: LysR family transcriptional regulator [Clostridia bacterium]|nr:LysR family transcriptional regulator [Clostridia bacterium]
MVKLEFYRVFYVVAKTGNLSKASKELFISQPAVSYGIKQLEEQLGGRLFVRTAKGMELTPEGKMMFDYVSRAYEELAAAENKFSMMRGLEEGTVHIGASDTITKYFILPRLETFKKKFPKITIKITNRTTDEIISLLKAGKVDLGFINLTAERNVSGVELTPCAEIGECFVANRELKSRISAPLSAKELTELPLILLEEKSSTRRTVEKCLNEHGGMTAPAFELCSVDLIADCVKAGLGVGCVTKEYFERELAAGEFAEVPLTFSLPRRSIAMATLAGMPSSFATAKLQDHFRKNSTKIVDKK